MRPKKMGRLVFRLVGITVILGALVLLSGAQQSQGVQGTVITTATTAGGGTTGSSTTGTTATTGSTGTPQNEPVGELLLQHMEERLHAPGRYIVGTNLVPLDNDRHVIRFKFMCPGGSSTQAEPTGGYWTNYHGVTAVAVPAGVEFGAETASNPLMTTTTVQNVPVAVVPKPPTQHPWYAWVQLGSSGPLPGGPMKFYVQITMSATHTPNPGGTQLPGNQTISWMLMDLAVGKTPAEALSIDSRRVYGHANLDGQLPGDPNADLGNNKFFPWIYRGGVFVGNMPYGSSKDMSGLARMQVSFPSDAGHSPEYVGACFSVFTTGLRSSSGSSSVAPGTIGLYRPATSDPNLNVRTNATWATRYTLNPGGQSNGVGDFTTTPYSWVTPSTQLDVFDGQRNYLNFILPFRGYLSMPAHGGNGNPNQIIPWHRFALCQTNESNHTWQYFASEAHEALPGQVFPLTDSRPRLWTLFNLGPQP